MDFSMFCWVSCASRWLCAVLRVRRHNYRRHVIVVVMVIVYLLLKNILIINCINSNRAGRPTKEKKSAMVAPALSCLKAG